MKALLSIKGVVLVCSLIALLFLWVAAVSYFTNTPNWQLWIAGAIPFGLVVLVIVVARGFGAFTWYLAGKLENVKLPSVTRPRFSKRSRLNWFSFILKRLAGGLVTLVVFAMFVYVLIEGGTLLGAIFNGLYLGVMVLIAIAPLLMIALLVNIADFINQSVRKSQAQNERLIALLEQQQRRMDQLEQERNP